MDKETRRQEIVDEMVKDGYRVSATGECDDMFALTRYGVEAVFEWVDGRWEGFSLVVESVPGGMATPEDFAKLMEAK